MNSIHIVETNDMGSIEDRVDHVIGGEALDEDFN